MSTYIAESKSRYEVADGRLDKAMGYLEETHGGSYHSASCREGTSAIIADECMFGGQVAYSWYEDVSDFLEGYCLPGSYATFRDDDEPGWWYMAVLGDNGKVEWHEKNAGNPFGREIDALEAVDGDTYDFRAETCFSVTADSLEEAEKLAEEWADENMQVVKGYDVDVEFIKVYRENQ